MLAKQCLVVNQKTKIMHFFSAGWPLSEALSEEKSEIGKTQENSDVPCLALSQEKERT